MDCLAVKEVSLEELSLVQSFYRSVGYSHSITGTDRVVVATLKNQVVGVGRIAVEEGTFVLRGMQVDRSMLKRGIGKSILLELDRIVGGKECYCIPHGWLEKFYSIIGFKKIVTEEAPLHLQKRFLDYLPQYPQLIIMKKSAKK